MHWRHHEDPEDLRRGELEGMSFWQKRINTFKSNWCKLSTSVIVWSGQATGQECSRNGSRRESRCVPRILEPSYNYFSGWVSVTEKDMVSFFNIWLSRFLLIIGSVRNAPKVNRSNWFIFLEKIYIFTFWIFDWWNTSLYCKYITWLTSLNLQAYLVTYC